MVSGSKTNQGRRRLEQRQRRIPAAPGRSPERGALPAPNGHRVVLGTAGSGKTTLAILRSLHLADQRTDHGGPTLLVTFNKCLVTYMRHLGAIAGGRVTVENYHKFARGYLHSRGRVPPDCINKPYQRTRCIRLALGDARANGAAGPILDRPEDFIDEEFQWIQGQGIAELEQYVAAERVGRAGARVTRVQRATLFELYRRYLHHRNEAGKLYDWSDLASAVLRELAADGDRRRYRHVIIDEGQDFSPEMLRSLAAAVPDSGSLTFFGDIAQQIYGQRISWRNAGLDVTRVWQFQENYRNTQQISRLALALADMPGFPDDPDLVESTAPTADGPPPALVRFRNAPDEQAFVISRAIELARTGTVAILFRTREQEDLVTPHLPDTATRLHGELGYWPSGPGLFHGTYHAAKGLEFDTVFLPLLSADAWPHPHDIECFGDEEAAERNSRLLYVGITRARSTLLMTFAGRLTPLLPRVKALYQLSDG